MATVQSIWDESVLDEDVFELLARGDLFNISEPVPTNFPPARINDVVQGMDRSIRIATFKAKPCGDGRHFEVYGTWRYEDKWEKVGGIVR